MTSYLIDPIAKIVLPSLLSLGVYAGCGVVVFLAVLFWAVCLFLAWRFLQKKQETIVPLRLSSASNLATVYQLRVELGDLRKKIKVACTANHRRLPVKTIQEIQAITETLPAYPAKTTGTGAANKPDLRGNVKAAGQKAQEINTFANLIASICAGIAAILPGALKTPFRDIANTIRQGQQSVRDVTDEPERIAASARSVKGSVKRLEKTTGMPAASSQNSPADAAQAAEPEIAQRIVTQAVQVIETYPVNPGESQVCRLAFQPRNPLRSYAGDYQIFSQPVELADFPSAGAIKAQSLTSALQVKAAPVIYSITAGVICVGILVFNTWWALLLIQWLLEFLKHA
ncbi:MAG TPA: hypothetical protein VHO48_13355 [Anaerolineaceae bacterium]|nr:hypothetical protein [Anaerolineaceae bacterium]